MNYSAYYKHKQDIGRAELMTLINLRENKIAAAVVTNKWYVDKLKE